MPIENFIKNRFNKDIFDKIAAGVFSIILDKKS